MHSGQKLIPMSHLNFRAKNLQHSNSQRRFHDLILSAKILSNETLGIIFVHCEKVPKGRNMIMRVEEFPAKMAFKNDHLSS